MYQLSPQTVKTRVDAEILTYFAGRKKEAAALGERYVLLWETLENLVLAGGKRFRPYMLLLSYSAYSQTNDPTPVMPAAVAQELLHAAMLIHDDIIDRDLVRYGQKNIAGQYRDKYASLTSDDGEVAHFSLSAALLAGDALLSDAHKILREAVCDHSRIEQAAEIFSQSVFEVIGGELLDTEAAILPPEDNHAETVARFKTASYSFVSPLIIGATLAGADSHDIKLLTQFAHAVGVGYQLRDDLLGVFGDSSQTGKSTKTDIIEGKRTMLIEEFERRADDDQKQRFARAFHNPDARDDELEVAKTLLEETGAKDAVIDRIMHLREEARAHIDQLSIEYDAKTQFYALIDTCLERNT